MNKNILFISYKQLKTNIPLWIFTSLYVISPIVILTILGINNLLETNNYIFFITSFSIQLIILFILLFQLFAKNKNNGFDVLLESKSYSIFRLYIVRLLIALTSILSLNLLNAVISGIIVSSFLNNSLVFLIYFLSIFFGMSLSAITLSLIMFFIFAKLSYIKSLIASLSLVFIIIFSSLLSHTVFVNYDEKNKLKYDINESIYSSQVITIDNDFKNRNDYIFIKNQTGKNESFSLPTPNIGINFMPGEWFFQPIQLPFENIKYSNKSNLYLLNQNITSNYGMSMNIDYVDNSYNVNISEILKSQNIFVYDPAYDNPFNYSGFELSNVINKLIIEKVLSIRLIDGKDINAINRFREKLENTNNYNNYFDEKEIMFLRNILGINNDCRMLFYLHRDYEFLKNYLVDFDTILINSTSKEFYDFFIWFIENNKIYRQIFEYENNIVSKHEINLINPDKKIVSSTFYPNKKDLDFFKNDLVRFNTNENITNVAILNVNGLYSICDLDTFNKTLNITNQVGNQQEWINYIDSNVSISLSNLQSLYTKLSQIETQDNNWQIYKYTFSPNITELSSIYSYAISIDNRTWINNGYAWMIVMIISIILMITIFYFNYRKY